MAHAIIYDGIDIPNEKINLLVAQYFCTENQQNISIQQKNKGALTPCLCCSQCKKVLSGSHVDVKIINEGQGKNIPVDIVRQFRADAFVRPFDGVSKVYIVCYSQNLNVAAQNALLTVLEEPPEYAFFILLATNYSALLPTVRSRCQRVREMQPDTEVLDLHINKAKDCVNAIKKSNELLLAQTIFSWDKLSRQELTLVCQALMLEVRLSIEDCSKMVRITDAITEVLDTLNFNVNVGSTCGLLNVKIWEAIV